MFYSTSTVKSALESINSSIFEPSELSDVSSGELSSSPPQEVPDVETPKTKKVKNN